MAALDDLPEESGHEGHGDRRAPLFDVVFTDQPIRIIATR
jgi:hypothetical protein